MTLEIQIPGLGHAKKCGGVKVVKWDPDPLNIVKKHCLN